MIFTFPSWSEVVFNHSTSWSLSSEPFFGYLTSTATPARVFPKLSTKVLVISTAPKGFCTTLAAIVHRQTRNLTHVVRFAKIIVVTSRIKYYKRVVNGNR